MNRLVYTQVVCAVVVFTSLYSLRAENSSDSSPNSIAVEALEILKNNCFSCHNEEKERGGLILTSRDALLRGGDNGPVIAPRVSHESALANVLLPDADPHMPPKKQLSEEQIHTVRAWIDADTPWAELPEAPRQELAASDLGPLPASYRPSFALALSPDGNRLALARGNVVEVFDTTQNPPASLHRWSGARDVIQSLAWSSDGQWLAAGEFGRILLWNEIAAEPRIEITNAIGRITALEFTPDNQSIIAADCIASRPGIVRIFNFANGTSDASSQPSASQHDWQAHDDTILDLAISPDGKLLASAGTDKLVRLWSLAAEPTPGPDNPEQKPAAETTAARASPALLAKLEGHTGHVWSIAFNTNGTLLASGGSDRELKVWDIESREQTQTIQGFPDTITGVAWQPHTGKLAASLADGTIRICDHSKTRPERTWNGGADLHAGIAISQSEKPLTYAAGVHGALYVWNHDGKIEHTIAPQQTDVASADARQQAPPDPEIPLISFTSDVLPILSKAGCNAGSCHAKPEGQNGFKLSVFAFDPKADHSEIVHDAHGRRVFPAHADESLFLKKPTMAVDHEGGQRIEPGSAEHALLKRWIEQGMPFSRPNEPELELVRVEPAENSYTKGAETQLRVEAKYSDGTVRDVTQLAEYDSTEKEIAQIDESGRIRVGKISGESVVIARFMGMVAISRVTVPREVTLPDSQYDELPVNNFIDELAYARFRKLGLYPSNRCTDAEFIRRASLDISGELPTAEEVREFLADTTPDKRAKLIDKLLLSPGYADHWASKWADLIRPNPDRVGVKSVFTLDQWLRQSFRSNKPYNQFAREIVTAKGSTHQVGPTVVFRDRREPADITTLVSQVFLGVRLECAKCHHHPNEKWSQEDFYQFAAYFGELKRKGTGISPPISGDFEVFYHAPGGEVKHPVSGATMKPKPPDGAVAQIPERTDPRESLADWMTDPENPFFAKAVANRIWAEFFGRGLVDPVDDFRASNPPSNPALLDALAADFVQHNYDLKHLMRRIAMSHLYQLSSLPNEYNLSDTRNFSRSYRRRLPAEVLADAITRVTDAPVSFQGLPLGAPAKATWNYKIGSELLDAFGRPNSSSDCPCERDLRTSVVQALHLMNSNDLQTRIANENGRARRLASSELSTSEIITELYLTVLSRYPAPEELSLASRAFAAADATRQTAVEDIMWALVNSAEFVFNH